jgi:hypothetical protein
MQLPTVDRTINDLELMIRKASISTSTIEPTSALKSQIPAMSSIIEEPVVEEPIIEPSIQSQISIESPLNDNSQLDTVLITPHKLSLNLPNIEIQEDELISRQLIASAIQLPINNDLTENQLDQQQISSSPIDGSMKQSIPAFDIVQRTSVESLGSVTSLRSPTRVTNLSPNSPINRIKNQQNSTGAVKTRAAVKKIAIVNSITADSPSSPKGRLSQPKRYPK